MKRRPYERPELRELAAGDERARAFRGAIVAGAREPMVVQIFGTLIIEPIEDNAWRVTMHETRRPS